MSINRLLLIRKAIEEAIPAEEYFKLERAQLVQNGIDAYVNEREIKSLCALVAYVAFNNNISEQAVCAFIEERFHVNEIQKLYSQDYDDAVKYLVELEPAKILN
jgi:hypothetical protein